MADNFDFTPGTGATGAAEDEAGVLYPKIKLTASGSGTTEDLSKAEDSAHASGNHGIMALTVRQDTAAALSGTDADYQPLITDANGRLHILDQNSAAILTALQIIDDWDDSDKCNVNLNVAGTDIAANAGVLNAQTIRVTIATDDEVNNLLGTIDADTGAIKTAIEIIDNTISGTEMQVDVVAALPAGTNAIGKLAANSGVDIGDVTLTAGTAAIGKLAANSGVDIGDVDVTSIIPLTGATNLGKARDVACGANDVGVMALAVRDDTLTTLTPADGDYVPLRVSSTGQLHVTGAGGGTEYTEDVASANPIVGSAVMMERDDALGGLTPAEGDWAALRCDANGALWVHDNVVNTLLGTIDSDTNDIKTAVELLDNAVDGNFLNCNMCLAGNDAVAGEGVIDSNTLRVTIATDDDGVAHLATIAGDTTSIDGKITACNTGAVVVSSGTITANLGATDNAVLDQIELNTDPLLVVGGGAEATAIRVTIANDSTGVLSVDDGGGTLTVDGTVTANLSATDNAVLDTIDAVLDTINAKLVTGTVIGDVNLGATDNAVLDAIAASLVTIDSDTNDIKIATEIMDDWDAIHGGDSVSDGPQVMAAYDSTKPTAVDDGDAVRILADAYGRLLAGVEPERFQATMTSADAQSATQVKAKTAAKKMYILTLVVSTDTAMNIQFQDDTGPTVLIEQLYLAANGGAVMNFPPEAPLVVNTNEDFDVITSAAGNISVTITGYLAP